MKLKFKKPEIKILLTELPDIITSSGDYSNGLGGSGNSTLGEGVQTPWLPID